MREALHTPADYTPFGDLAATALLDTSEGREIRARINDATTEFYADRNDHVRNVTLLVMRAKGLA